MNNPTHHTITEIICEVERPETESEEETSRERHLHICSGDKIRISSNALSSPAKHIADAIRQTAVDGCDRWVVTRIISDPRKEKTGRRQIDADNARKAETSVGE